MGKRILKISGIVLGLLFGVALLLLAPIDRTPLEERKHYHTTMAILDSLKPLAYAPTTRLTAGWHRESLIPAQKTPMAGYKVRKEYGSIHDTLYVRALVLDNGAARVAFVSMDLLIVPPLLKKKLEELFPERLPEIDFLYLSASHTHNGIGGWDNTIGGQLMTGDFNDEILDHLLKATFKAIKTASRYGKESSLNYFEVNAGQHVKNRLDEHLPADEWIRGIEVIRDDSSRAILTTFSAHATNIPSHSLEISSDYPAFLNRSLEEKGYDFALFMAGTVGSHRLHTTDERSLHLVKKTGEDLSELLVSSKTTTPVGDSITLSFARVPVQFGKSQMRLAKNIRLRNWAFNQFFAPLDGDLNYLAIGNIVFLGMPCDFSGEILMESNLYETAEQKGKKLIVTSFNGQYVGYITADHHYEHTKRAEVREMNWVGPYYGQYFREIIEKLLEK